MTAVLVLGMAVSCRNGDVASRSNSNRGAGLGEQSSPVIGRLIKPTEQRSQPVTGKTRQAGDRQVTGSSAVQFIHCMK